MKLPTGARKLCYRDLLWIEPIAKRFGEWEETLADLDRSQVAMVIPERALVYVYNDEHGLGIAGNTDEAGILHMARLFKYMRAWCDQWDNVVHLHFNERQKWQRALAVGFGCKEANGMFIYSPRGGGGDVHVIGQQVCQSE